MGARFDSLGYVRRLEGVGVERKVAEAHADVARDFILDEMATKSDLQQAIHDLEQRLTIRVGTMLAVAVGVLVAIERLFQ
ncbi:MAG: hypothetical protein ACU0BF_07360 [Paracoccaceae bacterium]